MPAFGAGVDVARRGLRARRAGRRARRDLPTVGAVLNIAGITSPVPFLETTLELWNRIFAVNATGTYLVTKAFLPEMIDGGYGRMLNMSSVSAQQGGGVFGKTPYSSAKAAVLGFTTVAGPRTRPDRDHRERDRPPARWTPTSGCTAPLPNSRRRSSRASRWAGRPPSTTSPPCSRSWPPRRPATSPRTTQNLNGGSYIS